MLGLEVLDEKKVYPFKTTGLASGEPSLYWEGTLRARKKLNFTQVTDENFFFSAGKTKDVKENM